jgi:predicted Rossmann-fold nucleotide-binding protein
VAKRGWILVYGGDAFVALPGGFGTLEELSEILVERQLDLHRKPLLLVSPDGFWDPLLTQLERAFAGAAPHPKVAQW